MQLTCKCSPSNLCFSKHKLGQKTFHLRTMCLTRREMKVYEVRLSPKIHQGENSVEESSFEVLNYCVTYNILRGLKIFNCLLVTIIHRNLIDVLSYTIYRLFLSKISSFPCCFCFSPSFFFARFYSLIPLFLLLTQSF